MPRGVIYSMVFHQGATHTALYRTCLSSPLSSRSASQVCDRRRLSHGSTPTFQIRSPIAEQSRRAWCPIPDPTSSPRFRCPLPGSIRRFGSVSPIPTSASDPIASSVVGSRRRMTLQLAKPASHDRHACLHRRICTATLAGAIASLCTEPRLQATRHTRRFPLPTVARFACTAGLYDGDNATEVCFWVKLGLVIREKGVVEALDHVAVQVCSKWAGIPGVFLLVESFRYGGDRLQAQDEKLSEGAVEIKVFMRGTPSAVHLKELVGGNDGPPILVGVNGGKDDPPVVAGGNEDASGEPVGQAAGF
ncbi:hypothetical protein ACQY0O_003696 [Thecaphora frezii]